MGLGLDDRALRGVYLAVVMGRQSGFLTAASAAARTVSGEGPNPIYLPERVFDPAKFLADVQSVHDHLGRCVIAISQGLHDQRGASPLTSSAAGGRPNRPR
jgi:6-phosphofructokinase 1